MNYCIVIPVYNHAEAIQQVVNQLESLQLPCILVNDGSDTKCTTILQQLARQHNWITLLNRQQNGGKGAAVIDGLRWAINNGFSHAVQIDADGQHNLTDIPRFIETSQKHPDKLILGQPVFGPEVPKKRLYGRKFTNLWIHINTLSSAIADGMCGFRCYPLTAIKTILDTTRPGQRMDFDIEIVVRLYWQGLDVINIPTPVSYPLDGVSHFNMLQDNLLISKKHAQLFLGMLWRLPKLLFR
jgi:glycosyltransferase involved in cell wall biosynthesis